MRTVTDNIIPKHALIIRIIITLKKITYNKNEIIKENTSTQASIRNVLNEKSVDNENNRHCFVSYCDIDKETKRS